MSVRNFWLELDVDGRQTPVRTGPKLTDGGFSLTVKQRHHGGIVRVLEVRGMATVEDLPPGPRGGARQRTVLTLAVWEDGREIYAGTRPDGVKIAVTPNPATRGDVLRITTER